MKQLKTLFAFIVCCFLSIAFIAYVYIFFNVDSVSFKSNDNLSFNSNWTYLTTDNTLVPLEEGTENIDVTPGNPLTLITTLPENIEDTTSMAFLTYHQTVAMYADGDCIYTYGIDVSADFGKSVGSAIQLVTIPSKYAGCELKMVLVSEYTKNCGAIPYFYYGQTSAVIRQLIDNYLPMTFINISIFTAGLAILILWFTTKKHALKNIKILYLAITVLMISLWFFTNTQISAYLIGNATVAMYTCYLDFMLLPVPLMLYFEESYPSKYKVGFKVIEYATILNFIVCMILQFTNVIDLKEMLITTHLIMASSIVFMVFAFFRERVNGFNIILQSNSKLCIIFFYMTFFIDMIRYYVKYSSDIAKFTRVGLLVYVIGLTVSITKESYDVIDLAKEADNYAKLAYTDMLTKLNNRTAYEERIAQINASITSAFTYPSIEVIVFDLNNLKKLNDTMGHKVGDYYITTFAKLLDSSFGNIASSYRTGGDEFITILENSTSKKCKDHLDILNNKINIFNRQSQIQLSVSSGIAKYEKTSDKRIEDTINRADEIMYENKRASKERETLQRHAL